MAIEKEEAQTVKVGSVALTVYPWTHRSGRLYWRFYWHDRSGRRQYLTRAKKADAVKEARTKAREIHNGSLDLSELSQEQARLCRSFLALDPSEADLEALRARKRGSLVTVNSAYDTYLESKRANAGASPHHVATIQKRLRPLVRALEGSRLSDVTTATLDAWLASQESWSATSRKRSRAEIVSFFRWAVGQGILPDGQTAAQRMSMPIVQKLAPATYTPEELDTLLGAVGNDFLPWLALGSLAGIRREELYPGPKSKKGALQWGDFRWEDRIIVLPATVSKTKRKRTIPIGDRLFDLLEPWHKAEGRCCAGKPPEKTWHGEKAETTRLGELVGGWRPNALRHSFCSYRCALVGAGITANEAGNSEAEMRRSYEDSKSRAEALAWFGAEPEGNPGRKPA